MGVRRLWPLLGHCARLGPPGPGGLAFKDVAGFPKDLRGVLLSGAPAPSLTVCRECKGGCRGPRAATGPAMAARAHAGQACDVPYIGTPTPTRHLLIPQAEPSGPPGPSEVSVSMRLSKISG